MENVKQVLTDWDTGFLVDIKVINLTSNQITQGAKCPEGYEDMFSKMFPGLVGACDCNKEDEQKGYDENIIDEHLESFEQRRQNFADKLYPGEVC
jgi:hypothetical protein